MSMTRALARAGSSRGRVGLLLTVLALVGFPLGAAAQVVPNLVPERLSKALRATSLPLSDAGFIVVPLAGGAPIAAWNAERAMNPASTMKLVTTYTTLSLLGPDYRWRTPVFLGGRLDGDVLRGDLIVKGGGDPKLVIEDMTEFAARLRRAGLREIRGDLVIDDGLFDIGDDSVERFDGDPTQPYNVRPHAALMNFKATKFVIRPEGQAASVMLDPALADVEIDNDIRLVGGPCRYGAHGLSIRDAGSESKPAIRLSGSYSAACGEQAVFTAVLTHRQFIHGFFKAAWLAAGGTFEGRTRIQRGAARGQPWAEWISPRNAAEVVADINKFSNNVMTRQLLLSATADVMKLPATMDRARRMMRDWLGTHSLSFPELVVDNGSGLSRDERITPAHLAQVLQHASRGPHAELMRTSLPQVGVDGTMKSRLAGDPIAGQAWIKTGSLTDVRSIAGYVIAASGRRHAVVMVVNGPRAESSQAAQDALLRWVYANG